MQIGKNALIGVVVAIALVGVAGFFYSQNIAQSGATGNSVATNPSAQQPGQSQSQGSSCMQLSNQPYAQFTYLISSDQLSADAQAALSGFHLAKSTLANGDVTITLTPTGYPTDYHTQTYTLHTGDKLYFIETSFGDENPQIDSNLMDDTAIVVNASGCVMSQ